MTVDNAETRRVRPLERMAGGQPVARGGRQRLSLIKALETVLISGAPPRQADVFRASDRADVGRPDHDRRRPDQRLAGRAQRHARIFVPGRAATRVCIFKNGVSEGGSGGAPVALGETVLDRCGQLGVNGGAGFSVRRLGAFYVGATLSNREREGLYDALVVPEGDRRLRPGVWHGEEYQPPADDRYRASRDCHMDEAYAGTPLDLTRYTRTFEDEFSSTGTITVDGGGGPWSATCTAAPALPTSPCRPMTRVRSASRTVSCRYG